jgi:hypothetical protein
MPDIDPNLSDWERHLCAPVTGRKVICAFEVLAGMTRLTASLQRWGAQRPLLIGDGVGTGPLPLETDADIIVLDPPPVDSLTEQVRGRMHTHQLLTPAVADAVARYDPAGTAVWWLAPVPPNTPLLEREVLGGRPPHQVALEDKLIVDDLLDAVGADRSPTVIAPASHDALVAASRELVQTTDADEVVWAGDARDGINGGADYVRWIRTPEQAVDAAEFFRAHCDRVRISPFLEGVPCSIHGIVVPDGVIVLRPVELATLRQPAKGRFVYGGMGTTWEPPSHQATAMRRLARDLGTYLAHRHEYRGAFGIDGVLTVEGFRPTEFNPRFSGGLSRLANSAPGAHLDLVQVNAVIGRDVGRPATEIEAVALAELASKPFIDVLGLSRAVPATETVQVRVAASDDGAVVVADHAASAIGTLSCGPSAMGAFVRFTLDPGAGRPGQRAASLATHLLALSDQLWQTDFGALEFPADVSA